MAVVNYKFCSIFSAAVSMVMMVAVLCLTTIAFLDYRARDFFTVSKYEDFTTFGTGDGTCVERITKEQLEVADHRYNKGGDGDNHCDTEEKKLQVGNRLRKLKGSIEVSVHGLYYASLHHAAPPASLGVVADAAATATLEKKVTGAKTNPVNFSMAYEALSAVAAMETFPKSCEEIYTGYHIGTIGDLEGHGVNEHGAFVNAIRSGKWDETKFRPTWWGMRNPYDNDNNLNAKSTWPLGDVEAKCDYDDDEARPAWVDTSGTTVGVAQIEADPRLRKFMYAHCVAQFQYASVGTDHSRGTFGVPLPGVLAGPSIFIFQTPDGFSDSTSYSTKARIYVGMRFGYTSWAYGPLLLSAAFLFADALVFLLSELGMPKVLQNLGMLQDDKLDYARDSLVIAATKKALRRRRFLIGFAAWFVSVFFYTLFIAVPWGFYHSVMPRPECEKGDPDHGMTATDAVFFGTKGGWKADWDATSFDLASILAQFFVLFFLAFTTFWGKDLFEPIDKAINDAAENTEETDRVTEQDVPTMEGKAKGTRESAWYVKNVMKWLGFAALLLIAGQAISGQVWGDAWADGVVAHKTMTVTQADGSVAEVPRFDEKHIHKLAFDQAISTFACILMAGLIYGALLQRHLIHSVGCFSAWMLAIWLGFVVVCLLPLIVVAGIYSLTNEGDSNKDCAVFKDGSKWTFAFVVCGQRFWTFAAGAIVILGAVVAVTLDGLKEIAESTIAYNSGAVVDESDIPDQVSQISLLNANTEQLGIRASCSKGPANYIPMNNYRAGNDPFFKFATSIETSDSLLYAPKQPISLSARRR